MLPGPCARSLRMQPLQPAATSGANSVIAPAGVTRPILAGAPVNAVPSVNQRFPSEPLVMALGSLLAVGTLNCVSLAAGAAVATPADNTRTAARVAASPLPVRRDMSPLLIPPREGGARKPAAQRRSVGAWRLR